MTGRNEPCPCGSGKKYKRCCALNTPQKSNWSADQINQLYASFELGDFATVCQLGNSFVQQGVRDAQLFELLGVSAYRAGELSLAVKSLEELLRLTPKDVNARNNFAQILIEAGEPQRALDTLNAASKQLKREPGSWNCLGNAYKALEMHHKAIDAYQQAISLGAKTAPVYCNLGSVQQALYEYTAAKASYDQALALDPGFTPARFNLALLYQATGRLSEAENLYQELANLLPDDPELMVNIASYWFEQKDYVKARDYIDRILGVNPDDVNAMLLLAQIHEVSGAWDAAESCYTHLQTIDPDNADVVYMTGQYHMMRGQTEFAGVYFKKTLELKPTMLKALAGVADYYLTTGKRSLAYEHIKQALDISDKYVYANEVYVDWLISQQQYAKALELLDKLLEIYPDKDELLLLQAKLYRASGEYEQAIGSFKKVVDQGRRVVLALVQWAELEEHRSQLDEAMALLSEARKLEPDNARLLLVSARLALRSKEPEVAAEYLDMLEENSSDALDNGILLRSLYSRGDALQQQKKYAEAYAVYTKAAEVKNRVMLEGASEEESKSRFSALQSVFSAEWQKAISDGEQSETDDKTRPVFIVGYPRSGTSLVEQIISSHPKVFAGGELAFIPELIRGKLQALIKSKTAYPLCLKTLSSSELANVMAQARSHYLHRADEAGFIQDNCHYFTDKMPLNVQHLGLISALFPDSPIIHIIRHPMDCCWSAFTANFANGHRYTASLEKTFHHYARTMALVEHYKSVLNMKYLELRYEDILADQVVKTEDILKFVDLPWDDECLRFYENKRVVQTASYAQVNQKLYTSSRFRYKHYYEQFMPLEPILHETLTRLGYSFEA